VLAVVIVFLHCLVGSLVVADVVADVAADVAVRFGASPKGRAYVELESEMG
jgi:hypothetical protein